MYQNSQAGRSVIHQDRPLCFRHIRSISLIQTRVSISVVLTYSLLSLCSIVCADPCVTLLHLIVLAKQRQIRGQTKPEVLFHSQEIKTVRNMSSGGAVLIAVVCSRTRGGPLTAPRLDMWPLTQSPVFWKCSRSSSFIGVDRISHQTLTSYQVCVEESAELYVVLTTVRRIWWSQTLFIGHLEVEYLTIRTGLTWRDLLSQP